MSAQPAPKDSLERLAELAMQMPWEATPADVPYQAKLAFRDAMSPAILLEMLAALKGVVRVADRATDEFDAARAAIAKVTEATP